MDFVHNGLLLYSKDKKTEHFCISFRIFNIKHKKFIILTGNVLRILKGYTTKPLQTLSVKVLRLGGVGGIIPPKKKSINSKINTQTRGNGLQSQQQLG